MGRVLMLDLSDFDVNVMQVAIDHMIEHLEDSEKEDVFGDFAGRRDTVRRLISARHLKTLFQDID